MVVQESFILVVLAWHAGTIGIQSYLSMSGVDNQELMQLAILMLHEYKQLAGWQGERVALYDEATVVRLWRLRFVREPDGVVASDETGSFTYRGLNDIGSLFRSCDRATPDCVGLLVNLADWVVDKEWLMDAPAK